MYYATSHVNSSNKQTHAKRKLTVGVNEKVRRPRTRNLGRHVSVLVSDFSESPSFEGLDSSEAKLDTAFK